MRQRGKEGGREAGREGGKKERKGNRGNITIKYKRTIISDSTDKSDNKKPL